VTVPRHAFGSAMKSAVDGRAEKTPLASESGQGRFVRNSTASTSAAIRSASSPRNAARSGAWVVPYRSFANTD
jgi:hypothetical protein